MSREGDVLKLPATPQYHNDDDDNDNVSTMWHIIRVDDLYIDIQPSTMIPTTDAADKTTAVATTSKNVINKTRNKLKGVGAIPLSPTFSKRLNNYDGSSNIMEEDDIILSSSKTIYTVPNAKYYKIVTTGCQMNVADSERIMGILENELGLQSLDTNSGCSTMDNNSVIKEVGTSSDDGIDNAPLLCTTTSKSSTKKKITTNTPDILLLNTCTSKY